MSKSRRTKARLRGHAQTGRLGLSLAAWMLAAVVVPAYFNIQSSANFEPDKAALMRGLALAAAGPWLLAWAREKRSGWRASRPGLIPGLMLGQAAVATAAMFLAADIATGFWGNADRGYGWLSIMAGLGLAWAAYELTRRGRAWQLVDAALLGSVIPALYGLMQVLGLDPVRGAAVSFVLGQRAAGSLGNPLFLGDYLLLAVILTAARVFVGPRPHSRTRAVFPSLLILQMMALAATGSRSALFGALAAIAFFFFAWGRRTGRRRAQMSGWLIVIAGGLLLLVAWLAPQWLPSRLGDLFAGGGTGGQRLLFWQAVADLFRHEPNRLFLGLGPDALALKLAPYLPPTIAHYEPDWVFRIPDRAHTFFWDGLATWGVAGQLLWTAFYAALMARVLPEWRLGRFISLSWLAPAAMAWLLALAFALLGGWRIAALGYGAGFLVGAWLVLLLAPERPNEREPRPFAPFLLAALAGHWLLLTFSFPTHAADLLLALIMGLAWAEPEAARARESRENKRRVEPETGWGLAYARLAGAAAAAFAFSLSAAGFSSLPLWLAATAFLLLLAVAAPFSRAPAPSRARLLAFALPILLILPALWLNRLPGVSAWLAYAWFWLWLILQLFTLSPPRRVASPSGRLAIWPSLALGLSLLSLFLLLSLPIFGDIAYKSAILSPWDAPARDGYMERAFLLSPHDHILAAGIVPTEELTLPQDAALTHPQAQRIIALYERALHAQPLAAEPPAAYAEWLRRRALADPAAIEPAFAMFEQALTLSPNDIQTRNRLALLRADAGDLDQAIAELETLLAVDPLYGPTYLNLAQLRLRQGDAAAARAILELGVERVFWWEALRDALAALPPL